MSERSYYLAFSIMSGIGPKKFEVLLKNFGSAKAAWNGSISELEQVIGKSLTAKFVDFRTKFNVEQYENELVKKKISFVCLNDKEYPQRLKKIPNAPIVLYIKGKFDFGLDSKYLAIVGTRRITSYGRSVTELFSSSLASSGLVIVSGLALGVDGVAHIARVESGGKTIAFLGNGVDISYPR